MASPMEGVEGFDDTTMEMLSANLPSNAFTTHAPDPRLERARQETERTQQITPLLKEELRLRILTKRLQKGEPEIEINAGEPISYELTEEEEAKRERRRAQNRRAAKKCRQKRKMKSLSDAEKFRLIREENQKLRNQVTYMRYREEIYVKYCIENSPRSSTESSRRLLLALLGSQVRTDQQAQTMARASTSGSVSESYVHKSQGAPSTSGPATLHINYQNQGQATCSLSPSSNSAHGVLRVEQNVNSMEELKELPVNEITSILSAEPDFNVSDHSLESTPPGLSPTSLFCTMSPSSAEITSSSMPAPYFSHMTPSTSYSGNNTSSFSSSNDDIFAASGHDLQVRPSFLDSGVSSHDFSQDILTEHLHTEIPSNERIFRKVGVSGILREVGITTGFSSQCQGQGVPPQKHDVQGSFSVHPESYTTPEKKVFAVAASNNIVANTAFLGEYPCQLECLLNSYLDVEQAHGVLDDFSGCDENPVAPTVPNSPLTPLSPPSPNVALSPPSPSPLSYDVTRTDFSSSVNAQSSFVVVPCHNPVTPARPIVRRTSSTTSVPSPYFNQYVSISLSPPPSVPSPASNGVPESPSILTLPPTGDDNSYLPYFSPVSATTSTDHSPGPLFEMSEEEFD